MKEISVGVCLNEYTWLEIWDKKKKKWIVQKDQVKKKKILKKKIWRKTGLEQKQKKRKKKEATRFNGSFQWQLLPPFIAPKVATFYMEGQTLPFVPYTTLFRSPTLIFFIPSQKPQ